MDPYYSIPAPVSLSRAYSYALARSAKALSPEDAMYRATQVVLSREHRYVSGTAIHLANPARRTDANSYQAPALARWSAIVRVAEALISGRIRSSTPDAVIDTIISGDTAAVPLAERLRDAKEGFLARAADDPVIYYDRAVDLLSALGGDPEVLVPFLDSCREPESPYSYTPDSDPRWAGEMFRFVALGTVAPPDDRYSALF